MVVSVLTRDLVVVSKCTHKRSLVVVSVLMRDLSWL